MGKLAIISDIHGDLEATKRAFEIIEKEGCEKTICLGDVLDEGADTRCIVSVGSLAYGRDYYGRKSFVIYDTATSSIDFHFLPNGSASQDLLRDMV